MKSKYTLLFMLFLESICANWVLNVECEYVRTHKIESALEKKVEHVELTLCSETSTAAQDRKNSSVKERRQG